jgi:hypothetical protein
MTKAKGFKFSDKHRAQDKPEPAVENEIVKRSKNEEIPCAVVFKIVKDIHVSPAEVGKTVDLMNYKLVKCQLGLFGYKPKKKIVKPQDSINQELQKAIQAALVNGQLSCERAWQIADRHHVRKMSVSSACEAMGIKIKPCQLGAF